MSSLIMNRNNNQWQTGHYPLILGDRLGLHDSMNVNHPVIFDLYKRQKNIDWSETESSLSQSVLDMQLAPQAYIDIMVLNLSYQWEFDSAASRSFATLLAPFITNSEFWLAQSKNQEIEGLHSLTYSEIVRQCIPDTTQVFKSIKENSKITERSSLIFDILENLAVAGAKYTLGIVKNDQELFNTVFLGIIAMFLSERLQFMSSFATTFITGEHQYFIGICNLVQKIAIDELTCHAEVLAYVIQDMIKNDPRAQVCMTDCYSTVKALFNDSKQKEYDWSRYILSGTRKNIVGLTSDLLIDWVDFNAHFAGIPITMTDANTRVENPLPFMDNWLEIQNKQNANQTADNNNYLMVKVKDDLLDDEIIE